MTPQPLISCLLQKSSRRVTNITLAAAALIGFTLPAEAANINFTYSNGLNPEYIQGAEAAALYWEDRILDDVTINLHLDILGSDELPTGTLGGAIPAFENDVTYYDFKNALRDDRTSSSDNTAVSQLSLFNDYWGSYYENEWALYSKMNLTRANAKALGLIDEHHSDLDGVIVLNDLSDSSYNWQVERDQDVGSNEFDYTSVLIHEIGHAMGFVSALDAVDFTNINDNQNKLNYVTPFNLFTHSTSYRSGLFSQVLYETPDDLDSRSYIKTNYRNITYGQETFFTIDGGETNLGYLSTGEDTDLGKYGKGNGWQASHWIDDLNAMMSPTLAPGKRRNTTHRDLEAFDVLGWDIDYTRDWSNKYLVNQGIENAKSVTITDNSYEIEKMLNQYRWGAFSRGSSFRQDMDLAEFLAQEGLFQKGTLWSHMPTETASVPEPASSAGLLALGLLGFVAGKKPQTKS